jgi:hypothetical protein
MLEPYEAQVSSTVLRGRGGSNTSLLPGLSVSGSSRRERVCAHLTLLVGRVPTWGRKNSGQWLVVSEYERREPVVREKRQNEANLPVVLIIGIL